MASLAAGSDCIRLGTACGWGQPAVHRKSRLNGPAPRLRSGRRLTAFPEPAITPTLGSRKGIERLAHTGAADLKRDKRMGQALHWAYGSNVDREQIHDLPRAYAGLGLDGAPLARAAVVVS